MDEEEHLLGLQNEDAIHGNFMPKVVRTLEGMFDLQSKFQKPTNVKTNSSSSNMSWLIWDQKLNLNMSIWENVARLGKYVSSSSCISNTKTSFPGRMKI